MRRKQKELRRHHLRRPSTCSGRKASRLSRLSASCSAPDWTPRSLLRDPNDGKRTITCLSWHPDDNQKLAAAYSCLEFQKASRLTCLDSYIWDIGGWIRQIAPTPAHARLCCCLRESQQTRDNAEASLCAGLSGLQPQRLAHPAGRLLQRADKWVPIQALGSVCSIFLNLRVCLFQRTGTPAGVASQWKPPRWNRVTETRSTRSSGCSRRRERTPFQPPPMDR